MLICFFSVFHDTDRFPGYRLGILKNGPHFEFVWCFLVIWIQVKHFGQKYHRRHACSLCTVSNADAVASFISRDVNFDRWSLPDFSTIKLLFYPLLLSVSHGEILWDYVNTLQFSSVQSLSRVRLYATPWIAARQASLSITISRSSLRLMSIVSMMPSSHLILCCPLLLLPTIPPSIRVISNESTLRIGGQSTGVSALASFLPKKSQGWSPSEWTDWICLQSKGPSRVFSNTTVQKHQFFGTQLSSQSNSHIHTWPLEKP